MNKFDYILASAEYISALKDKGFTVEQTTDFEAIPEIAKSAGRDFQMPGFNRQRADLTQGQAFWLFLKHDGEYVGSVAAQLQELGSESLGDYLKRTSKYQFPNEAGRALDFIAKPLFQEYTGRFAYMGELNIHRSKRGNRTVLRNYIRLLVSLAVTEWQVDWIYAFVAERHVMAQLNLAYGFARMLPAAQRWTDPEPNMRSSSEWFIASRRDEIDHMIETDLFLRDVL